MMFIQQLNNVQLTFIDNQGIELDVVGDMDNFRLEPATTVMGRWRPASGSFSFVVRQLTADSPRMIVNWVQHAGACARLESTGGAVWSWHMRIRVRDGNEYSAQNLHATGFSYGDGPPASFTFRFEAQSVNQ